MHDMPAGGELGQVILQNCQRPMTCFSTDGTMFAYIVWEERRKPSDDDDEEVSVLKDVEKPTSNMKLKNFMRKMRGHQEFSRSDPGDRASKEFLKNFDLMPVLCIVKTEGDSPSELIEEL